MHFQVLVEDSSGKVLLDHLFPKIIDMAANSKEIRPYGGVGHLPKDARRPVELKTRMLLNNLPPMLKVHGKQFQYMPGAVIVVVDLDTRNCGSFKQQLVDLLDVCMPPPTTLFRIAIEEAEAWLLGDRAAVLSAYPRAKANVLDRYVQDSICGTWETLADAVYPGGAKALKRLPYPLIGAEKHEWANRIAPLIDVEGNASRSFQVFRDGLRQLADL